MKKKDVIFDGTTESLVKRFFVKDGRLIPQYDEQGADAGLVISAKLSDPSRIGCPYCGATNNALVAKDVNPPMIVKDPNAGEPHEISLDGYRCATCLKRWTMLIVDEDGATAIGSDLS